MAAAVVGESATQVNDVSPGHFGGDLSLRRNVVLRTDVRLQVAADLAFCNSILADQPKGFQSAEKRICEEKLMSMIGCFYALRDDDLEAIVAEPKRIKNFGARHRSTQASLTSGAVVWAKAPFRKRKTHGIRPKNPKNTMWTKPGTGFISCSRAAIGRAMARWLSFCTAAAKSTKTSGYGPPHGFTSAEVKEIAKALAALNVDELYKKANPAKFTENEIYPEIWDKEDRETCIGYVTENLTGLRDFVQKTAGSNRALIAYLG